MFGSAAALFWQTLAGSAPLILLTRNAGILGAIRLPTPLLSALCVLITLCIQPHGSLSCDASAAVSETAAQAYWLMDAFLRGVANALVVRQALLVSESLSSALEQQLQLSAASPAQTGGSLTSLCLALFAARWWSAPELRFASSMALPLDVHLRIAMETTLTTLSSAGILIAFSGCILLCGELGVAALQRLMPQVISWQFALPLRLAIALQIFRIAILPRVGGG